MRVCKLSKNIQYQYYAIVKNKIEITSQN